MRPLKIISVVAFVVLLVFISIASIRKISLVTADLGRHIKNGELFFEQHHPISTNTYSYTQPEFHAVNHHWLTGVVFYLIWKCSGFDGLSVFYSLLCLATFLVYFRLAQRMGSFPGALLASVLAIPLITSRLEIRPEGFSVLLLGIYCLLLWEWRQRKLSDRWLWIIPVLQVAWVNLHIYFIFGLFVIGVYCLDALLARRDRAQAAILFKLGLVSLAACFLNPFGLEGVLQPLTIFSSYGYMLAENQSVFFMQKRMPGNPLYIHTEVLWVLTVGLLAWMVRQKGWRENFLTLVFLGVFGYLSFEAIRNIAQFGFFFIPFFTGGLTLFLNSRPRWERVVAAVVPGIVIGVVTAAILLRGFYYSPYDRLAISLISNNDREAQRWWQTALKEPRILTGLMPQVDRSAQFFRGVGIKGPIFNNYDIGGYLIYHLFPKEKVFVDNRPEAYSVPFFKEMYVPMQEDEAVWGRMDAQYGFNCIYFYRHDQTPWAQPFLIKRIRDPQWAPVYVDLYTIILLKRNDRNAELIRRFELPQDMFVQTPS